MGVSSTPREFAAKIQRLQQVSELAAKRAVEANRRMAVANAERELRRAAPSGRLRNTGKQVAGATTTRGGRAGSNLKVASKLEQRGTRAFVRAVGAWQLIEFPTAPHYIDPAGLAKTRVAGPTVSGRVLKSRGGRSSAQGRAGRGRALSTPHGPRRRVLVKGTRGKQPWGKAFERTTDDAPKALRAAAHAELEKVFR